MDLAAGAVGAVAGILLHGKAKLIRLDAPADSGGGGGLGGALSAVAAPPRPPAPPPPPAPPRPPRPPVAWLVVNAARFQLKGVHSVELSCCDPHT